MATTPAEFLRSYKAALEARPAFADGAALEGVTVHIQPTGDTSWKDRLYVLAPGATLTSSQEQAALGGRVRDEEVTVPGLIETYEAAGAGVDTDAAVLAAFDRAEAVLAEVVQQIRDDWPQVGEFTWNASVTDTTWTPGVVDQGGWVVRCRFNTVYTAQVA